MTCPSGIRSKLQISVKEEASAWNFPASESDVVAFSLPGGCVDSRASGSQMLRAALRAVHGACPAMTVGLIPASDLTNP